MDQQCKTSYRGLQTSFKASRQNLHKCVISPRHPNDGFRQLLRLAGRICINGAPAPDILMRALDNSKSQQIESALLDLHCRHLSTSGSAEALSGLSGQEIDQSQQIESALLDHHFHHFIINPTDKIIQKGLNTWERGLQKKVQKNAASAHQLADKICIT